MPDRKYYYMKVTADELELPLGVWETIRDMAKDEGRDYRCLKAEIYKSRSGTTRGAKYIKVPIE